MAHGEIILLKELLVRNDSVSDNASQTGRVYRVTGTISVYDPVNRVCQIEHQSAFLWVDISLVSLDGIKIDGLVQFIGEILSASVRNFPTGESELSPTIYLKATIKRIVDGLNLRVYEEAVIKRRLFLQKLKNDLIM